MFLEILQNPQEFSCGFCKFLRTPFSQSLFFNKVAGLRRRSGVFIVNFAHISHVVLLLLLLTLNMYFTPCSTVSIFNFEHVTAYWKTYHYEIHVLKTQSQVGESPSKIKKKAFYFHSKAFFILKTFKFLPWLSGHVSKRLIKKIRLIWSFITSQPG